MVPTCDSTSGTPAGGVPTIQDMPAFDMASYTVYEWMEAADGLGLNKPVDAKLYAMIYQASMHFRGYFQINQALFAETMGVSRQTLNGMLARFCDEGLIKAVKTPNRNNPCGGALKSPTAYYVAQEPINRAILAITERKRHQAIESWARNADGTPVPNWLLPQSYPHVQKDGRVEDPCRDSAGEVVNKPQLAPMSPNLTLGATCGNADVENHAATGEVTPSSTSDDAKNMQFEPNVAKFDIGATCGNDTNPQLAPMSPNLTLGVAKFDIGATCGNVKSDTCNFIPSTCGSDDKTAGNDFDQRYIEDRRERIEEDLGISESCNYVSPSQPYSSVGGPSPEDPVCLSPESHKALARFLAHWPKKTGNAESFELTARAWERALEMGYTPEVIFEAGMAYVDDFLSRQEGEPNLWYLKFPSTFLSKQDGLALWARKIRAAHGATDAECPDAAGRAQETADAEGPEPPSQGPRKDGPEVKRMCGVWVYRDGFGNYAPLGRDTAELTEDQARERARRLNRTAWIKTA